MTISLREYYEQIYEKYGRLTPKLAVDEARDPTHPLHSRFEWDDSVAGELYRHEQARQDIRSLKVSYRAGDEPAREIRAFLSIHSPEYGSVYERIDQVAADPFMRQLVLNRMIREWKALYERYSQFEEFFQLVQGDMRERKSS